MKSEYVNGELWGACQDSKAMGASTRQVGASRQPGLRDAARHGYDGLLFVYGALHSDLRAEVRKAHLEQSREGANQVFCG